jgi:hypothetical protein
VVRHNAHHEEHRECVHTCNLTIVTSVHVGFTLSESISSNIVRPLNVRQKSVRIRDLTCWCTIDKSLWSATLMLPMQLFSFVAGQQDAFAAVLRRPQPEAGAPSTQTNGSRTRMLQHGAPARSNTRLSSLLLAAQPCITEH